MGKCNSKGLSRQFTLDELADLPIGGLREMGNGCGPNIGGMQGGSCYDWLKRRGFGWPDNGEFEWGGPGSGCAMCSNVKKGYGCDNCSGSDTVGGKRGRVKRTKYSGDPANCCASRANTYDGKTCDPNFRTYETPNCDQYMLDYCKNNRWSQPECRSWVQSSIKNDRTVANVDIRNYCSSGDNFNKPECQEWCGLVRNNPDMRSVCDGALISYCNNNPGDPLCACMNPPENISKIEGLMASGKVCWYKPCQTLSNDNYITSTMLDQKNQCASTVCLIETGDVHVDGSGNEVKFDNNCATNILKPEYREPPEDTPADAPNDAPKDAPKDAPEDNRKVARMETKGTDNYYYIFGFSALSTSSLLLMIVIVIIIIFLI